MGTVSYVLRKTGERCTESVMGDRALKFAYETALGRSLWCILFRNGWLSALMGKYYDSSASKKAIQSLASIPGCNPDEAEKPLDDYAELDIFHESILFHVDYNRPSAFNASYAHSRRNAASSSSISGCLHSTERGSSP